MNIKTKKYFRVLVKWLPCLVALVLPFFCVWLIRPEWLGRLIAISLLLGFIVLFLLWIGFAPASKIIPKASKLNRQDYKKAKPIVVLFCRIFAIAILILDLHIFVLPVIKGISNLVSGGELEVVAVKVKYNSRRHRALYQGITPYNNDGEGKSYFLFYSTGPLIKRETTQEFLVLPGTGIVLEAKQIE